MFRIAVGLFLITLTTLMLELTLIRVLDVLWYPNMAYMVITLAMFCFGLAGVYASLRPSDPGDHQMLRKRLSLRAQFFALFVLAILPIMTFVPFDFNMLMDAPLSSLIYFTGTVFGLALPFFFAGRVISTVFSAYAGHIQALYFWDLLGAALGCVILVPLLPRIGPGGLMFCASGLALWAAGLFAVTRKGMKFSVILGLILIAIPFFAQPAGYLELKEHSNKRGVKQFKEWGMLENSYWDPISKIDVLSVGRLKLIAYDGGSQSSYIYPFDGDFKRLRSRMPDDAMRHFWERHVFVSYYLKRDTGYNALVIGSAGGQETKGALMYGAGHVDAVELVDHVVRLGKEDYAEFNGHIFEHPNVSVYTTEGRSFLRGSGKKYDIIQIFSNHTSSSIASGSGAMAANYLQTAEAYGEYFQHLTKDGILHINHHIYPRMITTAALAWKQMGNTDFQKHVVVYEAPRVRDNLPTLLIKMSPWTPAELKELEGFFADNRDLVIDPMNPGESFLTPAFFTGDFPADLVRKIPYYIAPATDDKPYFNFLRKKFGQLATDGDRFVNDSTSLLLNSQMRGVVPMDAIHLIVTGAAALFFAGLFILVPLYFSDAGKSRWHRKKTALVYFACLGAGFIILELVMIQTFMKLIGYPLYTYSTIVFTLLLAAGCGSYATHKFGIGLDRRWRWPFYGILCSGLFILLFHPALFDFFLMSAVGVRIAVAFAMIFPLGFFLGMPFPLGILAIEKQPKGAIGWAWGFNALFTVVGGLLSVVLSLLIGFKLTIVVALVVYALALAMFHRIRLASALP